MSAYQTINPNHNGAWIYEFRPVGRGIRIEGRPVSVFGHDLKDAIREVRRVISPAWGLRLARKVRS